MNALNKKFEKAITAGRIKEVVRIDDCAAGAYTRSLLTST